jgi:hypothetical protein
LGQQSALFWRAPLDLMEGRPADLRSLSSGFSPGLCTIPTQYRDSQAHGFGQSVLSQFRDSLAAPDGFYKPEEAPTQLFRGMTAFFVLSICDAVSGCKPYLVEPVHRHAKNGWQRAPGYAAPHRAAGRRYKYIRFLPNRRITSLLQHEEMEASPGF